MMLEDSYAWCRRVARRRAANFYYSFLLLDPPRRDAMCAVYAFMRHCDDLSDSRLPATAADFESLRKQMVNALSGSWPNHALWPAFVDTVHRYRIPERYFHEMIDGVASDVNFRTPETFDQLYRYCYCVASVVGLTVIHILGFNGDKAPALAEKCGVAFQLTNILRDVGEDYTHGRIYLPEEDMRRFGVSRQELGAGAVSEALRGLLAFEAARARRYYHEAGPLVEMVDPRGRAMLSALIETYYRLLCRIEQAGYEVLGRQIRVPAYEKLWIMSRCAIRRRPALSLVPA